MPDERKMKDKPREKAEKAQGAAAGRLRIEKRQDGRLWTQFRGKPVALRVYPCFPWSSPRRYISLRDDKDNEVALIKDLGEVESESRRLIEQALAESGFVMEIERVFSRDEEFEVRTWQVLTKQGPRKFQTKKDEWPQVLPDGALLIPDVAGDLFYIRDPHAMDATSRRCLAPFID